jgi:hypothetical protein
MINPEREQDHAGQNIQPPFGCGRNQSVPAVILNSVTGFFISFLGHGFPMRFYRPTEDAV